MNRYLGSAKRYLLNQLDQPAIVLLYHRVADLQNDPQLLAVSPENFYEQLNHLRKHFNVLSIQEFYTLLSQNKKLPKNSVVITFDDGYADNLHEAIPILESLDIQALFYITTSNLDTDRELWWDELERIFINEHPFPQQLAITINGVVKTFTTSTQAERLTTYNQIHPLIKYLPPNHRDKIIADIRHLANLDAAGRSTHRMLTTGELISLSGSTAAVIGAHTHNHPALSALSYEDQYQEILTSKEILESKLNTRINHFSYPFGSKKDYNKDTIEACQKIGFTMVCSNFYHQVHKWTDIFQVPRVLIRNWNLATFTQNLPNYFKY